MLLNGEKFWNKLDDEDEVLKKTIEYVYGIRDCSFSEIEEFINMHLLDLIEELDESNKTNIDYSKFKTIPNRKRRML